MKTRLTPRRLSWFGWFMGRVLFFSKIAAGAALIVWLCLWIWAGGLLAQAGAWASDKLAGLSAAAGMRVSSVTIEGRNRIDPEELKQVVGISPGDAMVGVDLRALHARLTGIAWVKDVQVRRAFPDKISIIITERLPIAIWLDAPGGPAVIDDEGVALARRNIASFGQLLAVEGKSAEKHAGGLLALLKAQPDIAVRVKKGVYVSERRWDLVMDGGTILRLSEGDPGFSLARASKAQAQEKVLDQKLKAIDLRQGDRIILENKPGESRDLLLKGGDPV